MVEELVVRQADAPVHLADPHGPAHASRAILFVGIHVAERVCAIRKALLLVCELEHGVEVHREHRGVVNARIEHDETVDEVGLRVILMILAGSKAAEHTHAVRLLILFWKVPQKDRIQLLGKDVPPEYQRALRAWHALGVQRNPFAHPNGPTGEVMVSDRLDKLHRIREVGALSDAGPGKEDDSPRMEALYQFSVKTMGSREGYFAPLFLQYIRELGWPTELLGRSHC